MNKLLVIVGPTSSGKTKLAIKLAQDFNGEIVNADAFQVYKEITVGTNKPNSEETKQVKFHLSNEISIYDKWSIKDFQDRAKEIINSIYANNKLPILVGGSNLYVDALIYNYDLSPKERNDKYDNLSKEELFDKLSKRDSAVADKIGINNVKRLVRALQILDENKSLVNKNKPVFDYKVIVAAKPREQLYIDANKNVKAMINNGWKKEVVELYKKDKALAKLNAFKAIGYPQVLDAVANNKEIDVETIKMNTRRYAKRQLTWIRHHYVGPIIFNQDNYQEVVNEVNEWMK